jgi:16S rRNA (adenine1518-N6/adenine1519-N6)-dimethyltransferase
MESHRQTPSYLMRRFEEAGIQPDRRRGQNFLTDLNLVQLLADSAELESHDVVLEVGTGLGSLTGIMAPRAAAVVTVEVDARMYAMAAEELDQFDNVTMLHQDALKNKNHFHPRVLSVVDQRLKDVPGSRLKLAANLPYNIATPIVSNLLSTEVTPVSMTVTIQKELADRLAARPSTKDYSALSIWVQSQCSVRIVRVMPPTVFWPRPKVDSAIVHIVPDPTRRAQIPDLEFFHQFVRSMFFHRRKFLRSVMLSAYKKQLTKPEADQIMGDMGLGPDARAEQLSVEDMLRLCECVRGVVSE